MHKNLKINAQLSIKLTRQRNLSKKSIYFKKNTVKIQAEKQVLHL